LAPSQASSLEVDIAIDTTGSREALRAFTEVLGHGGVGVVVGVKRQVVELPLWELFRRELQIVGSNGSRFDTEFGRAVRLIGEGRLAAHARPVVPVPLDAVPALLVGDDRMPPGAKLVAVPA
jgi:threonine dehydrogenase-like Zn-dependent dehydrogenase